MARRGGLGAKTARPPSAGETPLSTRAVCPGFPEYGRCDGAPSRRTPDHDQRSTVNSKTLRARLRWWLGDETCVNARWTAGLKKEGANVINTSKSPPSCAHGKGTRGRVGTLMPARCRGGAGLELAPTPHAGRHRVESASSARRVHQGYGVSFKHKFASSPGH